MGYSFSRSVTIHHVKVTALPAESTAAFPRSGWTASADSQFTDYVPARGIDANHSNSSTSFWASADGYPHYYKLDFGEPLTFDTVKVNTMTDTPTRYLYDWELYVSDDGATWGSAVATGTWSDNTLHTIAIGSRVTKRYIKLVGLTGSDGYMCIQDLWIFLTLAITDPLPNYILLFSGTYSYLKTVANGGQVTSDDGYDIIFTSDHGGLTKLDHEIDTYDPATGAVNIWIRIPSLSVTDETIIYLWYGNASVSTSQENKSGLWTDYLAIYHFGDGSTLSCADSKGSYAGSNQGATAAAGKIGGCASFVAASNQYIDLQNAINVGQEDLVAFEAWVNLTSGIQYQRLCSNMSGVPYNGYEAYIGLTGATTREPSVQHCIGGLNRVQYALPDIPTAAWTHLVLATAGALLDTDPTHSWAMVIVNGGIGLFGISGADTSHTGIGTSGSNMNIGRYPGLTSYYFDGLIDELRICRWTGKNYNITQAFAETQWRNQNDPSTFYSIGSPMNETDFMPTFSRILTMQK